MVLRILITLAVQNFLLLHNPLTNTKDMATVSLFEGAD